MTGLDVMWVGIGGGIGSVLRWLVGRWVGNWYHGSFPTSTFILNVSGAFVIAYLAVLLGVDWQNRYGDPINALVLTGVLGGYTTFSSMQLDALRLVEDKQRLMAVFYLLSSVGVGFIAAASGIALALA
jgi:CrcB protein